MAKKKSDKEGYVCVIINREGDVTIARTGKTPEARAKEISRSSGIESWPRHSVYVSDCKAVKTMVGRELTDYRVDRSDVFKVHVSKAIEVVNLCANNYQMRVKSNEESNDGHRQVNDSDGAGCTIVTLIALFAAIMYFIIVAVSGMQ